ncbi:DMT family transporter [Aromatoleum evansii]|uniref:DMT family transporter n=1 Tax=Aromatoleum evansii TaxID=59406 RepID=UPI00145D214B|nr:DMT family transporter [Aromatoleum evansii]NMG30124.1 EamA family transporter [Aromatoleum evansii]
MLAGLLAALGAGMLWGLVFVVPLMLGEYPGIVLAFGRYIAFGVLAVALAWMDRAALARLARADWIEAGKLALVGNLLYYATLASAIQLAGAPVPTLMIGTLPVVIAICANLTERRAGNAADVVAWRRLALPLVVILAGLVVVQFDSAAHATDAGGQEGARGGLRYVAGLLLAAVAVASWTWYPIRNARWLRARGAGLARPWATAQGLVTLPLALAAAAGFALWEGATASAAAFEWPFGPRPLAFVGLMLLTGLAASWLGTLLWNRASHLLPPAFAGQLIVFETLAALLYAFLWYGRWPGLGEAVGIVLLVAGVLLGVRVFRPAATGS